MADQPAPLTPALDGAGRSHTENVQRRLWARRLRTALAAAVIDAAAENWHGVEGHLELAQKQIDGLLWSDVAAPRAKERR